MRHIYVREKKASPYPYRITKCLNLNSARLGNASNNNQCPLGNQAKPVLKLTLNSCNPQFPET